jgi:hypothetical protein
MQKCEPNTSWHNHPIRKTVIVDTQNGAPRPEGLEQSDWVETQSRVTTKIKCCGKIYMQQ